MSIKAIQNEKTKEVVSFEARIYLSKEMQKKVGKSIITRNFKTKLEAEKWIKDKKQEIELDILNLNDKLTFQDLIEKFIKYKKEKWSVNTIPTFEGFVKNYFYPALSKILIKDFCKYDLMRFKKFLDKKEISDKTKYNVCTSLRSIIKFGIQENIIEDINLLLFIPKYSQTSEIRDNFLTVFQCLKLLELIDIEIVRDIILFLFNTGLRIAELCGLRFCDIDFNRSLLTVNNQIYYKKREYELKPVKCRKGKKSDTININSIALLIADKYRKIKNACDNDFIFTDVFNKPFRKDGFIKFHFNKAVKKAKELNIINPDDKICLHTLRHSFLTNLSMKNENPKKLQELARHKDYSFTYNRYVGKDLNEKPKSLIELENEFKPYFGKFSNKF